MWMQDKMLLQEELADNIGELINHLGTNDQVFLFAESFFTTMGREWHAIDRWRLDKFLMMLRRFVRCLFAWLNKHRWSNELLEEFFEVCNRTVLSTDPSIPDGVKFHFASVYLDELDLAGAESLNADRVTHMLQPFIDLLANRSASNYLFDSVLEEVFATILHQFSDELAAGEEEDEDEKEEATGAEGKGIQFNYAKLGQLLFEIAKAKQMRGDRRQRLYAIVKKFNMAANGMDPMSMEFEGQDAGGDIDENEINKAAQRLLRQELQAKTDRERYRKDRKRKQSDNSDDDDGESDAGETEAPPEVPRKSKKKKQKGAAQNNDNEERPKKSPKLKKKKQQSVSNEKSNVRKRKVRKVRAS